MQIQILKSSTVIWSAGVSGSNTSVVIDASIAASLFVSGSTYTWDVMATKGPQIFSSSSSFIYCLRTAQVVNLNSPGQPKLGLLCKVFQFFHSQMVLHNLHGILELAKHVAFRYNLKYTFTCLPVLLPFTGLLAQICLVNIFLFLMCCRITLDLNDGIYSWSVQAFNGIDGPMSDIGSFLVCTPASPSYVTFVCCFANLKEPLY